MIKPYIFLNFTNPYFSKFIVMTRTYQDLALAEEHGKLETAINESKNLLIEAPTGSGKSLYIPWFLSKHFKGRIVVLQPRRIAALALANYSAKLHNEPCGKTVGYQFRQDNCKSSETRILFQTYGNFLQELLHGKLDAEWVIFDEYHERKADMDLLFAFMLKLQERQLSNTAQQIPRLAIMSAKLNREEMEKALHVKCLELGHPLYPVQILHQQPASGTTLVASVGIENEVVRALRTLYRNNIWKTTLVFLPGKAEIARCHTAVSEALGNNCAEFLELYGGQDRKTQDHIFEDTERPRVIFTTNIAETSITVPNVTGVVDSGIERISEYDDSEKVNVLRTQPISLQNAIQRSGRSGRTQNGCAIRLWTEEAEKHMPQGIIPEVTQIEPSELLLQKASLEQDVQSILLPTAIPAYREQAATRLLEKLGMLQRGIITDLGKRTIQAPISSIPLAKILATAQDKSDLPDQMLAAMAWIHSGTEYIQKSKVPLNLITLASDTLSGAINTPREVNFTFHQLRDYRNQLNGKSNENNTDDKISEVRLIQRQLLNAFPDRLATPNGNVYKLDNGNIIRLQSGEVPHALLALTILRTGSGSKSELRVNLYISIPKELLTSEHENIRYELLWRSGQERFIGVEIHEEKHGEIVRELSRKEILPQEATPKILSKLKELTVDAWHDKLEKENWTGRYTTDSIKTLLIKMRLAAKLYPEYSLPEFNEEDMELIFNEFTEGIFLLRDLNEERYRNIIEEYFGKSMLSWLIRTFPDHYIFPNGKKAKYNYQEVAIDEKQSNGKIVQSAEGVLVEISARIEDFMQLRGTHKIAGNKLNVRYDILAPNFRTIQKTWDLTSFWQNTYAEVRKELRGRYPKHPWPETVI